MIFPKLVYSELKKIERGVRKDDIVHRRKPRRLDVATVVRSENEDVPLIRPRFRKLNTPIGPSRLVSIPEEFGQRLSLGGDVDDVDLERLPRPSRRYVDDQNLDKSRFGELEKDTEERDGETSLTLEEAAAMLEKAYGPEKLFVWLMKILIFTGLMLGVLGFAMSLPTSNPSLPSFTLWAACTVGVAGAVVIFACVVISFAKRVVEMSSATYMNAMNAGLAAVASITLLWYYYGLLTIGKKDSVTVRNNLSKLLWPLTFPLQGTPFVVGASFLTLMLLLYMVTSYKSTPVNESNPAILTTGFLFFTAIMSSFIQIMANRGYVVCDIRGNPWADNKDSIYSIWNRTYSIWLTVNSILAISFALSVAGDLQLDRRIGAGSIPWIRIIHNILIAAAYLGFMLFDVTSSQGKNDIIESNFRVGSTSKKEMMFHSLFNLGILGLAGLVTMLQVDWFTLLSGSSPENAKSATTQFEYKKED